MKDILLPALERLDRVLAERVSAPCEDWSLRLRRALGRLHRALQVHVAEDQAPGGLFSLVDPSRPTWARQLDDLCADHVDLLQQLRALRRKVRHLAEKSRPAAEWEQTCRRLEAFSQMLYQHWEEEADLVIECIIRDYPAARWLSPTW